MEEAQEVFEGKERERERERERSEVAVWCAGLNWTELDWWSDRERPQIAALSW